MSSIYIVGASGFIGSHLTRYFTGLGYRVFTERIEVTDIRSIEQALKKYKPDVLINCAGVRAYPHIDWCKYNKEETLKVNLIGAVNLMQVARQENIRAIQIASGCIYQGGPERQFTEEDEPNFTGSFYSLLRIGMQNDLKEIPGVLQLRIRMPLAWYRDDNDRNLLTKITKYSRVISVPNSATLLEDLAPALEKLVHNNVDGILNMTNEGYVTHQQLLDAYRRIVDPSHRYELISMTELEQDIVKEGRSNCILSMEWAHSLGIEMPALTDERIEDGMLRYAASLCS